MSSILLNSSINLTVPEWLQKCLNDSSADDRRQKDIALIRHAFEFAYQLHQGQYRKSGEAYICHPVAVADYCVTSEAVRR